MQYASSAGNSSGSIRYNVTLTQFPHRQVLVASGTMMAIKILPSLFLIFGVADVVVVVGGGGGDCV